MVKREEEVFPFTELTAQQQVLGRGELSGFIFPGSSRCCPCTKLEGGSQQDGLN
jgi:hypothetical protein